MQTWKPFGVGFLIFVLVRGCPNSAQQPMSLTETQPLQLANTQRESGLSSIPPLPLLKHSSIASISPLKSKDIQASSSSFLTGNRPDNFEEPQLPSPQIPVVLPIHREPSVQVPSPQIPVVLPVHREPSSRLAQQKPEIDFDVPRNQTNTPVNGKSRHNLTNQGANQQDGVNVIELPKTETELRLAPEEKPEFIYENSLNPTLTSDTTISTDIESTTPQNQRLSGSVVSSSSGSGSGRCNYPWELDSAGNRCGNRAASERPNLSTGVSVGSYSPPIQSYSIPTSSYGSTYVRGYFRRDGTYVRGHSRRRR